MAETDVIDLTGDDDDARTVFSRVFIRDVQIVHPNFSEVCFGLMEKMYVTAYSLPALVLLDDWITTYWLRILVLLKCHGSASSLGIGAINPFGEEFGSSSAIRQMQSLTKFMEAFSWTSWVLGRLCK